jgi:serine/threonine protein kinase
MTAAWPDPLPFGPWFLVRRLALSRMSDVWLGHRAGDLGQCAGDPTLCVIKRMLPIGRDDATIRALFQREIEVMQHISHPGVPRLLDTGEARGVPWLAMPFHPGASLQAILAEGPVAGNAALWLAAELAATLAAVHTAGIVHADVSPDNVLLCADGRVLLLDFGIAVACGQHAPARRGKAHYASPEQVTGAPLTPRTDLFAFGKILKELGIDHAPPLEDATSVATALRARVADPHHARAHLQARVAHLQPRAVEVVWQAAELRGEAVTDPGEDDGATVAHK